ncbi:4Fe-4S dicluster domain-containing protein [Streptosporangium sp. NPDC000396]|uniref:4Fe-4S dicluster domain-containing protein n=1 Tax=Streptosporangium sp. NPDC000396 TaxID=3366185 RepID=UPI0036C4315C
MSPPPGWAEVASRCLACANCTMVCPTCFCTTVEDATDLTVGTAERSEVWDSCFMLDFSKIGGSPVRGSGPACYRQWLTHKFSTWCPIGIDVAEELACI